MAFATSSATVVVPAPANPCWVRPGSPAVSGSSFSGAGLRLGLSRVFRVLGGFGEMLVVAYAFPLVILAIGIPIALFVRLAVESGRALWQL